MIKRRLGKCGFEVSEIGLGCWQLGGDFGPMEDERAEAVLAEADARGIDFWDTADVYGAGLSERRIGRHLARSGQAAVVATKVGKTPDLWPDGYTKAGMRARIGDSARRLGVETLDLVQLHCIPPQLLMSGDALAWMEDFQDAGLVRAFGASVETLAEALFAVTHPRLTSLQIIFNLFRHDPVTALFPLAEAHDVGIIVRLPLASGVLAGKMRPGQTFAPTDHRHYNRHGEAFSVGETFSGVPFDRALAYVERMRAWLPAGMSMAQMAMRWILDQPAVSSIIAGASRPGQVAENASVSALPPLPAALHRQLGALYRDEIARDLLVTV